jgi:hypothetical protein
MDTFEESLVCRDEREPMELALSKPPAGNLSSSFLLSFLELREKNDLPPEDCLDLLSADMFMRGRRARVRSPLCTGWLPQGWMRLASKRWSSCSSVADRIDGHHASGRDVRRVCSSGPRIVLSARLQRRSALRRGVSMRDLSSPCQGEGMKIG